MMFRIARLRPSKAAQFRHGLLQRATLVETLELRSMLSASVTRTTSTTKTPDPTITIDGGGLSPGGHGSAGSDYQLNGRWSSTATNPSTGSNGDPITLTWGFVNDGLSIPGYNGEATSDSNLIASLNSEYGSQSVWLPLFQSVFDVWSANTGITYVYQPTDDGVAFGSASGQLGVRADIRIGGHNIDGVYNVLAYNFYPGSANGGDMVIDTSEFLPAIGSNPAGVFRLTSNNNRALRNTLAHEHGHGLGLAHVIPTNGTKLLEPTLSVSFDGPQYDDILGVQTLYGDPLEKNGRNETPATATNLGTLGTGALTLASNVSVSTGDLDYFKFTTDGLRTVSLTATPVGVTYSQGPQSGGSTASFAAGAQANLTLNIYAADGTTLIQSANLTGAGSAETISNLNLAAGTYFVRVSGLGQTQMYQLTANVVIPTPPPAPSTPVLSAASDSGDSNSDGITNITTPTFTGTAAALSTVTLYAGTTVIGSVTAGADGSWSITSSTLTDGTYAITATASNIAGSGPASAAASVTIDTIAPTVTVAYDREITQDLTLSFESSNVATKLTIANATLTLEATPAGPVTPGQVVPFSALTFNGAAAILDVGALLADGRYRLSVAANAVTDAAGNPLAAPISFTFAQLAGDANNDGLVGFSDLVILAQNYNSSGKTFSQGNFNYDGAGNVDFADLVLLAQHYNISLPALSVPAPTLVAAIGDGAKSTTKKPSRDILG